MGIEHDPAYGATSHGSQGTSHSGNSSINFTPSENTIQTAYIVDQVKSANSTTRITCFISVFTFLAILLLGYFYFELTAMVKSLEKTTQETMETIDKRHFSISYDYCSSLTGSAPIHLSNTAPTK